MSFKVIFLKRLPHKLAPPRFRVLAPALQSIQEGNNIATRGRVIAIATQLLAKMVRCLIWIKNVQVHGFQLN